MKKPSSDNIYPKKAIEEDLTFSLESLYGSNLYELLFIKQVKIENIQSIIKEAPRSEQKSLLQQLKVLETRVKALKTLKNYNPIHNLKTVELDYKIFRKQHVTADFNLKINIVGDKDKPIEKIDHLEIYTDTKLSTRLENIPAISTLNISLDKIDEIEFVINRGGQIYLFFCDAIFFIKNLKQHKEFLVKFADDLYCNFQSLDIQSLYKSESTDKIHHKFMLEHKFEISNIYIKTICSICLEYIIMDNNTVCLNCNFQAHNTCSKFVFFKCKNIDKPIEPRKNKNFHLSYNIKHKLEPLMELDNKYCYHCGFKIYVKGLNCKTCDQSFHSKCKELIFYCCQLQMSLRKEMTTQAMKVSQLSNLKLYNIKLIKTIGKGSFSTVLKGYDTILCKNVAIKIVDLKKIKNNNYEQYLNTEISILSTIDNRYIVKYYSNIFRNDYAFISMEYVGSYTLFNYIKAYEPTVKQKKQLVAEILVAIEYLTGKNIVIRDLKFDNILITPKGQIKIIDFGISKVNKPDNLMHTYCGSLEYIAPEILNEGGYNRMVDIWALGVLVYEMFENTPPFYGGTRKELEMSILTDDVVFKNCNELEKDFITKLLEKDYKKRIGNENIKEIRKHPFFDEINFKDVETGNFDDEIELKEQNEINLVEEKYKNFFVN